MPHAVAREHDVLNLNSEKLFVNEKLLRPNQVAQPKESSPDMLLEELWRRSNEDGYVFLKGLLPKEDVLKAREAYFEMLSPSGVL